MNKLLQLLLAVSLGLSLAATAGCSNKTDKPATASSSDPAAYESPEKAVAALVDAARHGSVEKLAVVLGKEGADIVTSDDSVADKKEVLAFLAKYDEKHEIVTGKDGDRMLYVGNDHWPFPIPLYENGSKWHFDVEAGKEELTNRRVGRNELNAIEVCHAIADAQAEYATLQIGGVPQYAQQAVSDKGQRNGLYWQAKEGEDASPLGPLLAAATDEGYKIEDLKSGKSSYFGYRYKILKAQGPDAPGGARDYLIDGKMIGGFGVIAWPAEYGDTGVMSFIINHEGTVYQSDLGAETEKIATAMTAYNPDAKWLKVLEAEDDNAASTRPSAAPATLPSK